MRFETMWSIWNKVLLLSLALSAVARQNDVVLDAMVPARPGMEVVLTESLLSYIIEKALPLLVASVKGMSVPDISGSAGTPVGSIEYTLSNIHISDFSVGSGALQVTSSGVALALSSVSLHVTLDWHYREKSWPHVSDSGSADVSASGVSAAAPVSMAVDSSQRLDIASGGSSVSIGDLDINLHGGASWLYNLFVSAFSGSIKDSVAGSIQKQVNNVINQQGAAVAAKMPVDVTVGGGSTRSMIDVGFLGAPQMSAGSYISLTSVGEFQNVTAPVDVPFEPAAIPASARNTSCMVQFLVTDFVPNSAGYIYGTSGALSYVLDSKTLPSQVDIPLNTSASVWALILPNLGKTYPDRPMQIAADVSGPIETEFAVDGAHVYLPASVAFQVLEADGSVINAVVLDANVTGAGDVVVKGLNITGDVTSLDSKATVVSSTIGDVEIAPMEKLFNVLVNSVVLPLVNEKLSFPLPMAGGVQLISPQIAYGEHYVSVSTDIAYGL